jgi:hypothetical protein
MVIYEDVQKAHAIQKEITGSFFSGESTPDLVKRIETDIQKGKKAEIGEVRMYSGKPWVKVSATGNPNKDWQPQKSVKGNAVEKPEEKKEEENKVKVLDSEGKEKKTHEIDTDVNGVEVKPGDNIVWHHKKNGVNQYTKGVVSNEMDSFGHLMVEFEGLKILQGGIPWKTSVTVLPKEESKSEEKKLLNYGEALEIVRKYDPNYTPKKMDDMEFHVGVAHTPDGGWKVDEKVLAEKFKKVEGKKDDHKSNEYIDPEFEREVKEFDEYHKKGGEASKEYNDDQKKIKERLDKENATKDKNGVELKVGNSIYVSLYIGKATLVKAKILSFGVDNGGNKIANIRYFAGGPMGNMTSSASLKDIHKSS